jgi:hypothetical protein
MFELLQGILQKQNTHNQLQNKIIQQSLYTQTHTEHIQELLNEKKKEKLKRNK